MKKFFVFLLMLIVVTTLIFSACAGQTPAKPSPSPSPTSSPTAQPTVSPSPTPVKPIVLRFAHHNPPTGRTTVEYLTPFARNIEKVTNNRVKIEEYPSETLFKSADTIEGVKGGIADIAWTVLGFFPGRFPVSTVMSVPLLNLPGATKNSRIMQELYETTPEIQAEFKGMKVLFLHTSEPYFLATTKKPVTTLNDIKGLKIRETGGPYPQKL